MAESYTRRCWKVFASKLHYSKPSFFHRDWKTYTPLLPYNWRYQVNYVVHRWILVFNIIGWLITSMVQASDPGDYFKQPANWAVITFNAYVISTAISVTTCYGVKSQREGEEETSGESAPSGLCRCGSNKLSWHQIQQWMLFTMVLQSSLAVFLLYWVLVYGGEDVMGLSLHTQLLNVLMVITDFWILGIPIDLLHGTYLLLNGAVSSVMYFHATKTNIIRLNGAVSSVIYFHVTDRPITDFSTKPTATAVFVILGLVLVFLPLLHTVCFYLHSLVRELQYCCCRRRGRDQEEARPEAEEGKKVEL